MEELARALESSIQTAVEKAFENAISKYGISVPAKENAVTPKYYTGRELEDLFGVSYTTIWRWEKEKLIKPIMVKGRKMYEREVIDSLKITGKLCKSNRR